MFNGATTFYFLLLFVIAFISSQPLLYFSSLFAVSSFCFRLVCEQEMSNDEKEILILKISTYSLEKEVKGE